MPQPTCKDRVREHLKSRADDLRQLWDAYSSGKEDVPDLGNIFEYGLCFDYVAPETFTDQRRGYFRYQISWGGPSEEFRFYCTEGFGLERIEFWFLDWFDGAKITLSGARLELLTTIFEWFKESGTVEAQYNEAMKG
jgi:hypothetical protein